MPAITLRVPAALTTDTKRELAEAYTAAACRVFNCPPKAVYVRIEEVPQHNWLQSTSLPTKP
ncbi:tautomerase family protein [Paenalcaligenes sp. Me131]|uniref:tautomerase family protein n=1 Tax=Paenalcaligenes sp. Me131 TaxID=3392636 RepID=UPI003D2BCBC4